MALSIGELVGYVDLDTSAGEKAVGAFSGLLDKLPGQWGKALAGAATVAGGVFGASLAGAMNMEPANDRVAAALGLSEKQAERAGRVAGQVYADNWGESTDEVAGAIEAVISSIKGMRTASESELRKVTTQALTFASVMGVDVSRAVQVAGNMVSNGMAKNATQAFDLLTKASSKVPVELREDVLDATDEYGQFFNTLGIKGPQAMGMLAAGAAKGMYGIDKAGDAVKEFTIRATDMSTSSVAAYKMIGLNAGDMARDILAGGNTARKATSKIIDGLLGIRDPAKRANASIALFGTPLEDLNTRDIPRFLRSLQDGAKGLGKWRGATDQAGKVMSDNAAGNIASFTRSVKMAFVETIGGRVLPKVTEWTGELSGAGQVVSSVTGFLADHSAVLKPLGAILGGVVAGVAAVSAVTKAWAVAQGVLNAVLMANPIALVVVAIAGLAAGLVYAYKKSETFRSIVNAAFSGVQNVAGKVLGWLPKAVGKAIDFVRNHWKLIASVLGGPIAAAVVLVTSNWNKIKAVTSKVWAAIKAVVTTYIKGVLNAVGLVASVPARIAGWFGKAKDGAVNKMVALVTWLRGLPGRILDGVGDLRGVLVDAGKSIIQGLIDGVESKVGSLKSKLGSLTKLIPKVKGPASVDKVLLYRNGQLIMDGLINGLMSRRGKLRGRLRDTTVTLTQAGRTIKDGLLAGLAEGGDGMTSALGKASETVRRLFEDRAEATADAIEKKYGTALDKRKKAIESRYEALEKSLRKKLKGDKLSTALRKNKDAMDRAITRAENRSNKARNAELKSATQSHKSNQQAILQVMKGQRAALIENARLQEQAADAVKTATDELQRQQEVYDSYAASVRESFNSFGDVTQFLGDDGTASADKIVAGLQGKVDQAEKYRAAMDQLIAAGLNTTMLDQIKSKGIEGGLAVAEGIVAGGPGTIDQLNDLSDRLDAAGEDLGTSLAETLYGEGLTAQGQLVAGLTANQRAVVDAGTAMAQAFVAAMQAELDKQTGVTFDVMSSGAGAPGSSKAPKGKGGKGGKGKGNDKDKPKGKGKEKRSAPLIGTVVQRQGESADSLAERLWYKTRKRG